MIIDAGPASRARCLRPCPHNARKAIHWLAAKGIVDVSRNRSPAIRELSLEEVMEVLEVAEPLNALLARLAARNFDRATHAQSFRQLIQELSAKELLQNPELFAATRRKFYRLLLDTAGNRELRRHFASINMQVVYAQYPFVRLHAIRAKTTWPFVAPLRAESRQRPRAQRSVM